MEMMTTCRTCGETWIPDHADYVRGAWRTCAACRERAERLAAQADAPPRPLPRHHDRDGPTRTPTITAPKRVDPHHQPQPHSWNHWSKGN
jgi:hypothetical protein